MTEITDKILPPWPAWPEGCRDTASCERNRACMYITCVRSDIGIGRDIGDEIDRAIAGRASPAAPVPGVAKRIAELPTQENCYRIPACERTDVEQFVAQYQPIISPNTKNWRRDLLAALQSVAICTDSTASALAAKDAEIERLTALLNTPETRDFTDAVIIEAAHQRERWGNDHDAGKTDADWFWLIGYLAGKALHNPPNGMEPTEARLHRIITVAAAAANWHAAVSGTDTSMRPGIEEPR